jgi:hypothetical protein
MSMEDVVLVAMVREEICGGALRVDAADIPRHVAKAEAQAQQAKLEAATKGKADAEAKGKTEAEANAKEAEAPKAELELQAEAEAKAQAEAIAKHEAVKAKCEALAKAKAEAKEKHEADAREKAEAAREKREAKAEADAKVAEEAKVKAAETTAAKAELEAKERVEKRRLEIEAKSETETAEAEAKAEEERERVEAEKAELRAMQADDQIAKQRAAEKAARATTNASASSGWFSKIAAAAAPPKPTSLWSSDPWSRRHVRDASSPSTELGPLRGPHGPSAPAQHSSTTCSSSLSRESVSTHSATSITAAPPPASVSSGLETPTTNVPDAKNAGESPAETTASPTAPQDSVKPDGAATEPILRFSQYNEAGGWGFSIMKGGDANPEGPSKPTTDHHIREVSTASAMTTSGPGASADDAPSSSLEKEDDGDPWGAKPGAELTKSQRKRMRDEARKQARMGRPRPPSGATSNSVDNSAVQEPKPVATALVDIPVGKGEGVHVDARMESGRNDARVIVEEPGAAATAASTAETATAHAAYADQW